MSEIEQNINQTEHRHPPEEWRVVLHVDDEDGRLGSEHNPILSQAIQETLNDPTVEPTLTPDPTTGGCFLALLALGSDREEVIKNSWLGAVSGLEATNLGMTRVNGMRIALAEDIDYLPLDTPPEEAIPFMIDVRSTLEHFESLRNALTNDELEISDFLA